MREIAREPTGRRLLSVTEACEMLGIGRTFFYQDLVSRGRIKILKLGRRSLVSSDALLTLISELENELSQLEERNKPFQF